MPAQSTLAVTGWWLDSEQVLFRLLLPAPARVWANPFAATLAAMIWDPLICAVIMEQVELTASGVSTGVEVFNEIMEAAAAAGAAESGSREGTVMSYAGRLQVVRAIGAAIVLKGTMYPTLELLLRHAIQYHRLKVGACTAWPSPSPLRRWELVPPPASPVCPPSAFCWCHVSARSGLSPTGVSGRPRRHDRACMVAAFVAIAVVSCCATSMHGRARHWRAGGRGTKRCHCNVGARQFHVSVPAVPCCWCPRGTARMPPG